MSDTARDHLQKMRVLSAIRQRWGTQRAWSTRDLAEDLGADEHQVRGALAWLIHQRIVAPACRQRRLDRAGRPYQAMLYRWTGREPRPEPPGCPSRLAADWLSRAWV